LRWINDPDTLVRKIGVSVRESMGCAARGFTATEHAESL